MTIQLMIIIETLPGHGDKQRDAFRRLAPVVRAEPGCLQYDLHDVTESADQFVLLEQWDSPQALAAHDAAPHMIDADRENATFRAGPARVFALSVIR